MKDDLLYLHRNRFDVWVYRRPVPKADQAFWRGPQGHVKTEWNRSLCTKDKAEAHDRWAEAHAAYAAEREEQMQARSAGKGDARKSQRGLARLAQDDPDYLDGLAQADRDALNAALWEAEHDPLHEQREALRAETGRLRDAAAQRELWSELKAEQAAARSVTVTELFEDWAATWGKPDTVAAYRSYIDHFADHVTEHTGKTDANKITEDDVAAWRNHLRASGGLSGKPISAVTINGAYMAAVNAVFGHARSTTRKLTVNPAADLPALRVKKQPRLRPKSIADDEAITILQATMEPGGEKLTPARQSAKRWCQWLMAYTGARVGEVAQLRKEDVGTANSVPFVHITPEAGKNKNEAARKVPLHPHLVQQGFLAFVAAQPAGPLFYDPELGRGGRLGSQTKKVGQYLCKQVRAAGVTVAQPNHGWRHRMETMNSRYDLRDKEVRWILGHAGTDANSTYGDHELPAMLREIKKIPAYFGEGLPPFSPEGEPSETANVD